jgi:hypothetical protein
MDGNPNNPVWSPEYREANHLRPLHPAGLQRLQWGPNRRSTRRPPPLRSGHSLSQRTRHAHRDVLPFLRKQA